MSRIVNKPIIIPDGVSFNINGSQVTVKGSRGELTKEFFDYIIVSQEDNFVWVKPPLLDSTNNEIIKNHKKKFSPKLGLVWRLLKNMVEGVSNGYKKVLLLEGTGYRANVQGNILTLQLGFSNDIKMEIPEGISISVEKDTKITIEGNDKESVGEIAMVIKKKRPVEPYKGKGVRFENEYVKRKESKKASK